MSISVRNCEFVTDVVLGSERPLPKAQRRGAVIILGMLALAKRTVVADRVETLVKIGLGNLGKVRLYLAPLF